MVPQEFLIGIPTGAIRDLWLPTAFNATDNCMWCTSLNPVKRPFSTQELSFALDLECWSRLTIYASVKR